MARLDESGMSRIQRVHDPSDLTPDATLFNPPALAIFQSDAKMLKEVLDGGRWSLNVCTATLRLVGPEPEYPLITLAARRGECACIEELLARGAQLESIARSPSGEREKVGTPLMVAIEHKQQQAAALLLSRRADPNANDPALNTPAHLAAMFDDVETLVLLDKAGADLKAANTNGRTALHFAISHDHPRTITWLLEKLDDAALSEPDRFDETPLHYAVKARRLVLPGCKRERGTLQESSSPPPPACSPPATAAWSLPTHRPRGALAAPAP